MLPCLMGKRLRGRAASPHTRELHLRTPPAPPDGRRPGGSPFQARVNRRLDVFPGNHVFGVCLVLGNTPVELSALRIGQRHGSAVLGDAVPKLLDQSQPLLDTQLVNAKGFQRCLHGNEMVSNASCNRQCLISPPARLVARSAAAWRRSPPPASAPPRRSPA